MKQYPADFRDRLLRALDAGLAPAEAARAFGVTDRTIRRWQQRRRTTGTVAATPRRGVPAPHRDGGRTGAARAGAGARRRHVGRALRPLGGRPRRRRQRRHHVAGPGTARAPPQKKSLIAAERDEAKRQAWRGAIAAVAPQRFVFLDETATPTNLTRLRARAPRGERAIGRVPHKRWHSVTLLASITPKGMGAALVLDGALARESFDAYVEQLLLPTLVPGQIVVLDNLPVHKSTRARALIEGAGCTVLFLPAYSPDFNPIELAFAKIKQTLRGKTARTIAGIVAATGPALDAVTAADARGFFAHCGFHLSGQLL
jgi:transposase